MPVLASKNIVDNVLKRLQLTIVLSFRTCFRRASAIGCGSVPDRRESLEVDTQLCQVSSIFKHY
jgi:hypothetical protein